MTIVVEPTDGDGQRQLDGVTLGQAIRHGGQAEWIVPDTMDVNATRHHSLAAGPLGGFAYDSAASSGLTASFRTGELFTGGAYVASDDTTVTDANGNVVHEVDLDASTANQLVKIGWNHTGTDDLRIALESTAAADGGFTSPENPRVELWEFDTDSSSITSATGRRTLTPIVDDAVDAQELGGVVASEYFRSGVESEGFILEVRNDRPSNPSPGRMIYRSDKDA